MGFSKPWRIIQGHPGGNLADKVYASARRKGIDVLAISSAHRGKPTGIHNRYEVLLNEAQKSCKTFVERREENYFVMGSPTDGELVILNSQLVIADFNGKRNDFWVIGNNCLDYDEERPVELEDALVEANKNGIVLTKPSGLFGLPDEALSHYVKYFSASILSSEATAKENERTERMTSELREGGYEISAIPLSCSHTIGGIGYAYIEAEIDTSSEKNIIGSLRHAIRKGDFKGNESHQPLFRTLGWKVPFGLFLLWDSFRRRN